MRFVSVSGWVVDFESPVNKIRKMMNNLHTRIIILVIFMLNVGFVTVLLLFFLHEKPKSCAGNIYGQCGFFAICQNLWLP